MRCESVPCCFMEESATHARLEKRFGLGTRATFDAPGLFIPFFPLGSQYTPPTYYNSHYCWGGRTCAPIIGLGLLFEKRPNVHKPVNQAQVLSWMGYLGF